jgi:hypothetical protein
MLGSMALLGYLVSLLDAYVFTMPSTYLRYCLIGIVTVNAMFLSRAFLWFYFWQLMYAIVPCAFLAWFFGRSSRKRAGGEKNLRRVVASGHESNRTAMKQRAGWRGAE